jgi:SAM-dependent methyltransferase
MFIDRADLFLKVMNLRWQATEALADAMVRVLADFGITSGELLDLCCGNGRVCVHMAKRGFRATGVDISGPLIEDARRKARENGVSASVRFIEGDVRHLGEVLGHKVRRFDVVTSTWTSIGYSSKDDDLSAFRQARDVSREGAVLIVAETGHAARWQGRDETSFSDLGDCVMLEEHKFDPITSTAKTNWTFYRKSGSDLIFIDRLSYEVHMYSLGELSELLRSAGWSPVVAYGSLITRQPVTSSTGLNLVCIAR